MQRPRQSRGFLYTNTMTLEAKIRADFITAYKAKHTDVSDTLRLLQSAMQNRAIEKKGKGDAAPFTDEEVLDIIRRETKKRKEAITIFMQGGRADLAEKEEKELKVLEVYLPAQMSEDAVRVEVQALLKEVGPVDPKDFGKTTGLAMKRMNGRADAALVQKVLKECLG